MSTQQQQTSIVVVSPNNREAKKVIDYKIFNGKRYYKVKWESSWESEDSLGDYQYLVDQFWDFVKRVSSEDSDSDPVRKRPRLSHDENENQEEEAEDHNVNNSEEDIQIKGTITLSEGVKIQESGNFYRLTQEKETGDENDGSVFIVQGSHSPLHSIKNTQSRVNKGNVHVIGLQHDPKSESTYSRKIRHHEDGTVMIKSEDDRKYLCEVCGMAFRRNDIRRRHEITHSKEYRYFCAICGKGFIRRYVLVKHLSRDHNSTDVRKIIYQKNKKKFDEETELGNESKESLQQLDEEQQQDETLEPEENGKAEMLTAEEQEAEDGRQQHVQLVNAMTQHDNGDDDIDMQHGGEEEQIIDSSVLYVEGNDENADEHIHATALLAAQIPGKMTEHDQGATHLVEVEGDEGQIIKVEMIT